MERKDWTLLAIAAAHGGPVQPVQLQKSLFLLGQKLPELVGDDFYTFEAYDYGPFSKEIYQDAEVLAAEDLVTISVAATGRWREYSATVTGLNRAKWLRESGEAPERAIAYLERAVEWTRSLSFNQLIRSIYTHYPDYKVNSVFEPA